MKEMVKEMVAEYFKEGDDMSNLSNELYHHEFNWNNADPTSGMNCYSEGEIQEMIDLELDRISFWADVQSKEQHYKGGE